MGVRNAVPAREPLWSRLIYQARRLLWFDFFISYGRRDATAYARELHRQLELRGFMTFIDRREIYPGGNLDRSILAGLRKSRRLIVLDTPAARSSLFVTEEIALAKRLGKSIIPIRDPGNAGDEIAGASPVAIDEPIDLLLKGLPSSDAVDGVIRGAAAVRNLARLWLVLLAIAALIAYLSWGMSRDALATYTLGLVARDQRSDGASIQDLVDVSRTAAIFADNDSVRDAVTLAESVVMKRRAVFDVEPYTKTSRVRFAAISRIAPPQILVVAGGDLLRISPRIVPPQASVTHSTAGLLLQLARRVIHGSSAEPLVNVEPVVNGIDVPDSARQIDPPVAGTPDGAHIAVLMNTVPTIVANGLSSSPCYAPPPEETIVALEISRDGRALAARTISSAGSGSPVVGRVRWWDIARCGDPSIAMIAAGAESTGDCTFLPRDWSRQLAVSDDGRFVAVPDSQGVQVFDTRRGARQSARFADRSAICLASFLAHDRLAAATAEKVAVFAFDEADDRWTEEPGGLPADRVVGITSGAPRDTFVTVRATWTQSWKLWTRRDGLWNTVDLDPNFAHADGGAMIDDDHLVGWSQHDGWEVIEQRGSSEWTGAGRVLDRSTWDDALSVSVARPWVLKQTPTATILFELRLDRRPAPSESRDDASRQKRADDGRSRDRP